jgi:hypothetical protein
MSVIYLAEHDERFTKVTASVEQLVAYATQGVEHTDEFGYDFQLGGMDLLDDDDFADFDEDDFDDYEFDGVTFNDNDYDGDFAA